MAGRSVDRLSVTRGGAVAAAIVRRAEMRSAFQHLAGNSDLRLAGVVALRLRSAAWIVRYAAGLRRVGRMAARPEVCRPFPDVTDHVVEAVAIGWEGADTRGPRPPVGLGVLVRKRALPGIGHVLAAGGQLVAPGEFGAVEAAARGEFPFGFGRQVLAGPGRISLGVPIGDVNDRVIVEPTDR